jgi:hypothetical protein
VTGFREAASTQPEWRSAASLLLGREMVSESLWVDASRPLNGPPIMLQAARVQLVLYAQ